MSELLLFTPGLVLAFVALRRCSCIKRVVIEHYTFERRRLIKSRCVKCGRVHLDEIVKAEVRT